MIYIAIKAMRWKNSLKTGIQRKNKWHTGGLPGRPRFLFPFSSVSSSSLPASECAVVSFVESLKENAS